MFRVNQTDCGEKVQIVHQKTGAITRNPTIFAVQPEHKLPVRIEISESMCQNHFLQQTKDAIHFIVNGRGVPPSVFLKQFIEAKK